VVIRQCMQSLTRTALLEGQGSPQEPKGTRPRGGPQDALAPFFAAARIPCCSPPLRSASDALLQASVGLLATLRASLCRLRSP